MTHNRFYFGARSLTILYGVNPNLFKVAQLAISKSDIDFGVVQGKRTPEQQARLYGQGRSKYDMRRKGLNEDWAQPTLPRVTWTLNSNHIGGNAIDVCPFVNGVYDWDNDGKKGYWNRVAHAFEHASEELVIPIYWGGLWAKPDRPHFSLVNG